jgi:hypothetical protein
MGQQISRALALERSGDYLGAARSLMSVLDEIDASSEWDGVFERIAADLEKVGEGAEAGSWYETVGRQRASDCRCSRCRSEGELASAKTTAISMVLERACPPA